MTIVDDSCCEKLKYIQPHLMTEPCPQATHQPICPLSHLARYPIKNWDIEQKSTQLEIIGT